MSQWNPSSGSEPPPADPNEDQTDAIPGVAEEPAEGDETLADWRGQRPAREGERSDREGERSDWEGERPAWESERPGPAEERPVWESDEPGWYREPPHPGAAAPHEDTYVQPAPAPQAPESTHDQPPIWAGRGAPAPAVPEWEHQQPPKAYLHQEPEPPGPRRRRRALIATFAVIVVLVAGGAALALEVRSHSGGHSAGARPRAGGSQRPSAGASPQRSQGSTAPAPSAGASGQVRVSVAPAAAGNPAVPGVVSLLTRYFRAINTRDYRAYRRLLDDQMRRVETAQRFSTGFRSTRDSGARLMTLPRAPDGRLAAVVAFTSHQSPADSPDQSGCTHWTITLFLEHAGRGYVIGPPPAGYQATHAAC